MEIKHNIIEVKFRLYEEKGTEFSIFELNKEVGIQKASFYAHFASKELLLYEIIDREIYNYSSPTFYCLSNYIRCLS